jgi:hypothetical protein
MSRFDQRDNEIRFLRKGGASIKDLAFRFGISESRVRGIVLRFDRAQKDRMKVEELQAAFRSADDLDKRWPAAFLLEAMASPHLSHRALKRYFENNGIQKFSLKELMDFLIPEEAETEFNPWDHAPALKTKGIGGKTYKSFIRHLSRQDLGQSFNRKWSRRTRKIKRFIR